MSEESTDDPWRDELDVIREHVQGVFIEMFKPWLEAESPAAHAEALAGITGGAIVAPIGRILDELESWATRSAVKLTGRAAEEAGSDTGLPSWSPPRGWLKQSCAGAIQAAGEAVSEYRNVAALVVSFMEEHAQLGAVLRSFFRGTNRTGGVPTLSGDPAIDDVARALELKLDAAWAQVTRATEALDRALDIAVVGRWNEWLGALQQQVDGLARTPQAEPVRQIPQPARVNTLDLAIIRAGALVREGPAPTFTVRVKLPTDSPAVVLDETVPGWLKIRLGGAAGDGWVETSWLRTQP